MLERCWALRNKMSASDAVYAALTDALEATLITCDEELPKAPGRKVRVEVVK